MSYYSTASASFTSSRPPSQRDSSSWRRNRNSVIFTPSKTLGPVAHTVLVVLMLAVLGLIYLTQITKTGMYSYQLDALKGKETSLTAAKQDLEVENARLEALDHVRQSDVAKNMTTPAATDFASE